jgi:hypothetical protein
MPAEIPPIPEPAQGETSEVQTNRWAKLGDVAPTGSRLYRWLATGKVFTLSPSSSAQPPLGKRDLKWHLYTASI